MTFWQVLVRNVPPDPDETVSELVEHFFLVNHPDNYLTHQVNFLIKRLELFICISMVFLHFLNQYLGCMQCKQARGFG